MKNNICFLVMVVMSLLAGCNSKKNSDDSSIRVGTDSTLMNNNGVNQNSNSGTMAKDSTSNGTAAKVPGDSSAKNSKAKKTTAVKPDSTNKIKRGKVSLGQNKTVIKGGLNADKEGFYNNTEILPSFTGGEKALENFFEKNMQYPEEAIENNAEGTVLLNFAVDERGKIYAPKVMSKNIGYGIEKEALRVFNKMPAWLPGKIKGKNVKTHYTLPIKFQLDN